MFKPWNRLAAAVVVVCACTGAATAQSAVGSPGFEDAIQYDVPPSVGTWTAFFGGPPTSMLVAAQNTTAPRTGTNALQLKVSGDGNAFCGVQQPITGLQPGVSYTMRIWARAAGNINNAVEYRMEWKNASGGIIGDQFALTTRIDAALTSSYQQFSLTAVAPPGTAGANLVMAAQSFVFNPANPVFDTDAFIDDVSFSADALPTQAACCFSDGTCTVALSGACPSGSTQQAASTTCSPNNCPAPQIGACCNPRTGACVVLESALCTPLGTFRGTGTSCSPNQCPIRCPADFNGVNGVTVQDIFDFLSAFFTNCP
jgi:hypothetical protein